jgi:hypothetical protein
MSKANTIKALVAFEVSELVGLCGMIEDEAYAETGLKGMNGAFVKAKVVGVDDDDVTINLIWGQCEGDKENDYEYCDEFIIGRNVLNDKDLAIEKKFGKMERNYDTRD